MEHEINPRKIKKELLNNLFSTMSKAASSRYMPKREEEMPGAISDAERAGLEIEVSAHGRDAEDLASRVEALKKKLKGQGAMSDVERRMMSDEE